MEMVDALAVAIGTAHGVYKPRPCLDLGRLKEICAALDTPLVLHGLPSALLFRGESYTFQKFHPLSVRRCYTEQVEF